MRFLQSEMNVYRLSKNSPQRHKGTKEFLNPLCSLRCGAEIFIVIDAPLGHVDWFENGLFVVMTSVVLRRVFVLDGAPA
jgi:hypothetical protein